MIDQEKLRRGVQLILEAVGEDLNRHGLQETPARVADMYRELLGGTGTSVAELLDVVYQESHDDLVLVKNIPFYSMCEHHLIPFFGHAHIAYIPRDGRVTGLSKLVRLVEVYARRLQMQERMTSQIADGLMHHLNPQGVGVVIEAEHLCMSMRGVQKPGTKAVTSAVRGSFRGDSKTRLELFSLIKS